MHALFFLLFNIILCSETPFLAWNLNAKSSSPVQSTLNSLSHTKLVDQVFVKLGGCKKVNLVVHQPALDSIDLLTYSQSLKNVYRSSEENPSIQITHLDPSSETVLDQTINALTKICGEDVGLVYLDLDGTITPEMISHSKNILVLVLPYFKSDPVNTLQSNDEKIQRLVDTIKTELDESDIMVMFMGGDDKVTLRKRQLLTSTLPFSSRSIFQKYIFFNKGILPGLIVLLLLLSILVVGINAIASIQAPTKFPKKK